jgi:uncharacterized membrane protein YphA (DoxX/SURF4 family)
MRSDLELFDDGRTGPSPKVLLFKSCLKVALFFIFLVTGLSKLLTVFDFHLFEFQKYGLPTWALYTVGATEVLGAICILVPRTSLFASSVFSLVLFGATVTHLFSIEILRALFTGVLFSSTTWLTLNDQGSIDIELELDKNFSPESFEDLEDSKINRDKSA